MAPHEYIADYAGLVTFARSPSIKIDDLPEGSVAVLGVPIDSWVVARSGQRWGPRRIREQSLYPVSYYYRNTPGYVDTTTGSLLTIPEVSRIYDVGDVPIFQTDVMAQTEAIAQMVAAIVGRGALPVLLGGDHYVPYPGMTGFVRGMQQLHPDATFGYLHIDSHLDFWDDMGGMLGRYSHGTCTRRISENPAVRNMVWFGVNGGRAEFEQFSELRRRQFVVYDGSAVRRRGPAEAMREALTRAADGVDYVYVSCDIDVIDGAYAPGTHSIVVSGLTAPEYLEAMGVIQEFPQVRALDVCEVLPAFDSGDGRTCRLAALGILAWVTPRIFTIKPQFTPEQMREVYLA